MKYKLNDCIGARFRKISRKIDNIYRVNLANTPVTEQQMNILFYMKLVGVCEQGQIGRDLTLERSTVSRNIKILANLGFVLKSEDYRPTLKLTKSGLEIIEVLIPIWEKIMDQLTNEIGEERLAVFKEIENRL